MQICRARTKAFFLKTFTNIQDWCRKLPRNPFHCLVFSNGSKNDPKLQVRDDEGESNERSEVEDQCSRVSGQGGVLDLKEEKKRKHSGRKVEEPSFLATENFARKMEELEMMMDVKSGDHVTDIDEVIHQYSLLTSPAYLDIVDKFFTDVYVELYPPHPSKILNSSTRKHGSVRKLNSSMRRMGCSDSVHGSTRKLGSTSVHGSMRKLGSTCVHGSMRRVGADSVHGSMRKMRTDTIHGSLRKLGPQTIEA